MSNPAQVIVLAEDTRQCRFVLSWIRKRRPDLPPSIFRVRPMAQGLGSGAQRVLDQYEPEVRAHLMRHASKWLMVVIDADNQSVQDRLNQLAQELSESEDERVSACRVETEQIARLVPKWSVETWILCLNNETVNEETKYKRSNRDWDGCVKLAAFELDAWSRSHEPPPERFVESLRHGIGELRRLTM